MGQRAHLRKELRRILHRALDVGATGFESSRADLLQFDLAEVAAAETTVRSTPLHDCGNVACIEAAQLRWGRFLRFRGWKFEPDRLSTVIDYRAIDLDPHQLARI